MSQINFARPILAKALKHIKKMDCGGSNSQLIASDAGNFVVKAKQNPQGLKVVVNEIICALLALTLLLPCPKAAIVYAAPDFVGAGQMTLETFHSGPYFGSQFLAGGDSGITTTYDSQTIKQAFNFNRLPGIAAFDIWTANTDRKPEHLISYENQIYMIDHGHNFTGPNWTASSLRANLNSFYGSPLKEYLTQDALKEYALQIRALDPAIIRAVIDQVPGEWGLTDDEKNSLFEFLTHRQGIIEELLLKAV